MKLEDISIKIIGGGTPSTSKAEYWNGEIAWTTSAHLTGREIQTGQKYITKKGLLESSTCIVPKQNILIATRVGIGKVAMNKIDIAISQDLTGILINKKIVMPEYLYWALTRKKNRLKALAQGSTIKGILRTDVDKIQIPLPPLPEQKKIAEILSTVDQTIEKTEYVIKRTERLKDGFIIRLLSSGIGHRDYIKTQIGKIPKTWDIVRIGSIADVRGGKRLPKGEKLLEHPTPFPYIRVLDFKNLNIDKENIKYLSKEVFEKIKKYTISSKDVYISIAGTVGISGIIPQKFNNSNLTENAAKICNFKRDILNKYLAYVLNSHIGQKQISSYVGKAQQPKLALFRIEKILVPIPPLDEQKLIVEIIESNFRRLSLLQNRRNFLERVKKGLMNDLLTGERRVRL